MVFGAARSRFLLVGSSLLNSLHLYLLHSFNLSGKLKDPFFLSSYFKDYITIQFLEFKTTALIINFTSAVHVAFFLSRLVLSAVFLSVHSVTTTRSLFMQFILYLPSY